MDVGESVESIFGDCFETGCGMSGRLGECFIGGIGRDIRVDDSSGYSDMTLQNMLAGCSG